MPPTQKTSSSFDRVISWMKARAPENEAGSLVRLGDQARANQATFHKVLRKGRMTNARDFLYWLDNLGARIVLPGEEEVYDEVAHTSPQTASANEPSTCLAWNDSLAVPVVSMEVAAHSAHPVMQRHVKAWLHLWKGLEVIAPGALLVAVEIGPGQNAMAPLLQPGDFVVLDKQNLDIHYPKGNIFLIQEPRSKGGRFAIRRVVHQTDKHQDHLVFFCDDPGHPPAIFDLSSDYGGDLQAAIKGRVIWACQDMTHR